MAMQQEQVQQPQGRLKVQIQQPDPSRSRAPRRSSATVTRVLEDLMVFIATDDGKPVGLVFKPDKIDAYKGEQLRDLGIAVGAPIPTVLWDEDSFKVLRVELHQQGFAPLMASP